LYFNFYRNSHTVKWALMSCLRVIHKLNTEKRARRFL
jgi:hypothetical protein